jgi:hypothetical protein
MLKAKCPECGSTDIRFTMDTVTGVWHTMIVIQKDGTLGIREVENWDRPSRALIADWDDMNLYELAYCGGCSLEEQGHDFIEEDES